VETDGKSVKTAGVRFKRAGKIYTFEAGELELKSGDPVVVETERGMALGTIATPNKEAVGPPKQPLKKILRIAEEEDTDRLEKNAELQSQAKEACDELAKQKGLDMKVLDVECLFDRSKVIFFFVAEGRVDFRELVRDLARRFHTRIEMRQVGVRDEAKMVGGLGCCGRELCCSTWLSDFAPISVRMAKSQNISLNPAKISGICGRLMCCLAYENKMYEEMSRGMPKVGKRVTTYKGEGKVIRRNALEGNFVIYGERGETEIDLAAYKVFQETGEVPEETVEAPEQVEQPKRQERQPRQPRQPRQKSRQQRGGQKTGQKAAPKAGQKADPDAGQKNEQKADQKTGDDSNKAKTPEGEKKGDRPSRQRRRRRRRPSQAREKKDNG
jgi:cell fate regulator YaaT (PSP1 superfamily)